MLNLRISVLVAAPALACLLAAYAGLHAGGRTEAGVSRPGSLLPSGSASVGPPGVCRYSPGTIRADLFGTPVLPLVKPIIPSKQATPHPLVVVNNVTQDPLSGYSITGIGELNGERYVLFEDKKTREGRWLKVGDEIDGANIASIDPSGVTLSGGQRLALNDKYDLTPLDKDAAYLGGRVTKHEGMDSEATASKLAVSLLADANRFVTRGNLSRIGEDYNKLNDDAFEGKVPLKEYHERVNAAPVTIYNDIAVSYRVLSTPADTEAFILTKEK